MIVARADINDLGSIIELVESQKIYLRSNGIPQWQNSYPDENTFKEDIELKRLYVLKDENKIIGIFALIYPDDCYDYIENGQWLSSDPYIAVHRLCIADEYKHQGMATFIFDYLKNIYSHIKVDTHKLNTGMNRCLVKNGFIKTGIVYMKDKTPRNAYEWLR